MTRVEVAMRLDCAWEVLPRNYLGWVAEIHLLIVRLAQLWTVVL
jgi:hypothetical protein